jgi:hypothetical protein
MIGLSSGARAAIRLKSDISMTLGSDRFRDGKGTKTTAPADSHVLTNRNTRGALDSLTLEIKRDPVLSVRYGHSWKKLTITEYKDSDSASKPRRMCFDA